ncbi:MAG: sulfotransferase [Bacteroidetes bacterium]|nr:sulfotransferase [Bacteroidota bacterium]
MKAFFIVGHWNSGTTLLVDVLRKHPDLQLKRARFKPNLEDRTVRKILWKMDADFPEFGEYEDVLKNGFANYPEPDFNPEKLAEFRKRFIGKYGKNEKQFLLLKNPWLLFFSDLMQNAFAEDDTKFLFVIRDGRSQVSSKDYWLRSNTPQQHLINRAGFWARCMEYYFEHWHGHPNLLTIRYENLCSDPEGIFRQICEHRNIDFEPLKPHLPAAFENRMSKWNKIPDHLKPEVEKGIAEMQVKINELFPVY